MHRPVQVELNWKQQRIKSSIEIVTLLCSVHNSVTQSIVFSNQRKAAVEKQTPDIKNTNRLVIYPRLPADEYKQIIIQPAG